MKLWSTIIFTLIISSLSACGSLTVDLRKDKSKPSPIVYSSAQAILGWGTLGQDWILGEVIRVDDNKINPRVNPYKFLLDPGVYEVEMSWLASRAPVAQEKVDSNSSLLPLGTGGVYLSGNYYKPKKTFIATLNVKDGYDYFVNLSADLVGKTDYREPKRLCISEIRKNENKIKVAPSGNIASIEPVKNAKLVACSP